eukprot:3514947-Prymnesium_polylepis.1
MAAGDDRRPPHTPPRQRRCVQDMVGSGPQRLGFPHADGDSCCAAVARRHRNRFHALGQGVVQTG